MIDPRLQEAIKTHLGALNWQGILFAHQIETLSVRLSVEQQQATERRIALGKRIEEIITEHQIAESAAEALRALSADPSAANTPKGDGHGSR